MTDKMMHHRSPLSSTRFSIQDYMCFAYLGPASTDVETGVRAPGIWHWMYLPASRGKAGPVNRGQRSVALSMCLSAGSRKRNLEAVLCKTTDLKSYAVEVVLFSGY